MTQALSLIADSLTLSHNKWVALGSFAVGAVSAVAKLVAQRRGIL